MSEDDMKPDEYGRTIPAPPPGFHEQVDDEFPTLPAGSLRPAPVPAGIDELSAIGELRFTRG